jgi:integrase
LELRQICAIITPRTFGVKVQGKFMATIYKRGDKWRAEIRINDQYDSGTFATKTQAKEWSAKRETELREQGASSGITKNKTNREAFSRYELEVSKTKRGYRWEAMRLSNFAEFDIDGKKFGDFLVEDTDEVVISRWRDLRMTRLSQRSGKPVSGSTVKREMNLLANVFNVARKEWKWISHNPTKEVRRPKEPPPRDRRISEHEMQLLCFSLGFDGSTVKTQQNRVAVAFLFAIETAMREGEICALTRENIRGNVAHIPMSKNGMKRNVPLSPRALELLSLLPEGVDPMFGISANSVSTLFSEAVKRCMIKDLKFHDTRHEATTRLAKIFNVLELARITGHKDIRQLMIYFNATADELAKRFA